MKRQGVLWFILLGLLALALPAYGIMEGRGNSKDSALSVPLTATPTSRSSPLFQQDDLSTKAVMDVIQAQFEARLPGYLHPKAKRWCPLRSVA
ncbi:MAG: hypothetical protein QXS54_12875 [Candidatus Methanomethylicaceae archaeon]